MRRRITPLALRIALVAFAALAATVAAVVLHARGEFVDLAVYAWGGREALAAGDLYDLAHPESALRFTYPPIAALLFALAEPARLLTPIAWTVLSLLALARASWLLANARGTLLPQLPTAWAALFIASAIALTEPAAGTLLLGQVGFFLLWMVCEDLLVERPRTQGALVGLATAIKLTPGVFVLLLAGVGRWRAAAVASATVLATIAIGFLALPTESATYWSGTATQADRVGAVEYAPNQSINGIVWRLAGPGGNDPLWLALAVAAGVACLLLARRWWLAGPAGRAGAIGLTGLASLLASPVSWTHHWLLVAPLVVGLLGTSRTTHRTLVRVGAITCAAVLASRIIWRVPNLAGAEFDHTPLQAIAASAYPLVGAALLALAWVGRPELPTRLGDLRAGDVVDPVAHPQLDRGDVVAAPGARPAGRQRH